MLRYAKKPHRATSVVTNTVLHQLHDTRASWGRGFGRCVNQPSGCGWAGEGVKIPSHLKTLSKIKILWPLRLCFDYIFQVKCNQSQIHGPKSGIVMIPLSGLDSSAETTHCFETFSWICKKNSTVFNILIRNRWKIDVVELWDETPREIHVYVHNY